MMNDYEKIREVLNNYARACDSRDWPLFEKVFIPEVEFNYGGEYGASGREKLVKMIKNSLGGCGPTQHLLGNFSITVTGDRATCTCYVRAFHAGLGEHKGQIYEALGEYRDELTNSDGQWKIGKRKFWFVYELGPRALLRPA